MSLAHKKIVCSVPSVSETELTLKSSYLYLEAIGDFDMDVLPFPFIRKDPDSSSITAGTQPAQIPKIHTLVSSHRELLPFVTDVDLCLTNLMQFPPAKLPTLAFREPFSLSLQ